MREVLDDVAAWAAAGRASAAATVVRTWSSAPRQPGAAMAVSDTGEAVGSVSGGCVEGAVYELGREVIDSGTAVLQRYGVSDDDAFTVGLTCGGTIELFVEKVDTASFPEIVQLAADVRDHVPVALATVIEGRAELGARLIVWNDRASGTLGSARLDEAVIDDVRGFLAQGRSGVLHIGADGQRREDELTIFIESFAPPPRMYVFGATDFAGAVVRIGRYLGYRVTVCDARPVFATAKRFPEADEIVVDWPHRWLPTVPVDERTALCVLTHDPKFDIPLLEVALKTEAGYIGVMGSRRTHDDRTARLREIGITEEQLERLHSPIGLDLGARTPEETAVSIAAEIVSLRWGGTGRPLRLLQTPIHVGE
ncbi:MAG: XdhC family protein [Actinobacteria bacterium]|nr:XdhC family protein [Actinomycetota bacterium]